MVEDFTIRAAEGGIGRPEQVEQIFGDRVRLGRIVAGRRQSQIKCDVALRRLPTSALHVLQQALS